MLGGHFNLVGNSHAIGGDSAPAAPADVTASLAPGARLTMFLVDALNFLVAPLGSASSYPLRNGLCISEDTLT
jgi:hypothetical protein